MATIHKPMNSWRVQDMRVPYGQRSFLSELEDTVVLWVCAGFDERASIND